jgi:hypothetical protein
LLPLLLLSICRYVRIPRERISREEEI